MDAYVPELGQMVFGQPAKQFPVPSIWEAALAMLREELDRVMWNVNQKNYSSPFGNSGERFDCPVFSAHAYSWGDEEQPWNFKWGDVEIGWYKYLGRGMSANQELSPDRAAKMLVECLAAVQALDTSDLDA